MVSVGIRKSFLVANYGATPSGDPYMLPNQLVQLVLKNAGWNATSLGGGLPFETIQAALEDRRPRLFWLSVSVVENESEFLRSYREFTSHVDPKIAIVVGGRGITDRIRKQMKFSSCCDNLQQLESYVNSLDVTVDP